MSLNNHVKRLEDRIAKLESLGNKRGDGPGNPKGGPKAGKEAGGDKNQAKN